MNEKDINLFKQNYELRKELNTVKSQLKKTSDQLSFANNKIKQLETKIEKDKLEQADLIEIIVKKAVTEVTNKLNKEHKKEVDALKNKISILEKRLNTNSGNSGIPTSKDKIGKSKVQNNREKSNNEIGGQNGHKIHKLDYFKEEEITEKVEYTLNKCPKCGGKLDDINIVINDVIDVTVKVIKRRNNIHNYKCKCCGKKVSANDTLPRAVIYGENVNSIILSMMNEGNVAINKIAKHISGISNNEINLSEGYIAKLQKNCSESLKSFCNDLKETIIKLDYVFWDDTVVKIEKDETEDKEKSKTRNGTIRFYGNDNLALLIGHNNKNTEGIVKDGILNNLPESCVCMHDHLLLNYNSDFNYQNAECNQHALRYLKSIKDNFPNHTWQDKMRNLLSNTNNERTELIKQNINNFDNEKINNILEEYDDIIKLGYKENNSVDISFVFNKKDELNLIERLEKYKENHLLFIKDFNVAFTNNTSERGLRQCKRKLAVSFLFKNINRMKDYANIISYLETCYRNGISRYEACKRLVSGNPYSVKEIFEKKAEI